MRRIHTRLGSTVVIDGTLAYVPRHEYPIVTTTRISAIHLHGDVHEALAYWRFGNRSFSSVAYSHSSSIAATLATARLVGELNTMRGLGVLGVRGAA